MENIIDLLLNEQNTLAIQYNENQSNTEFAVLAKMVNELHDDYIRYYCYNNKLAGRRIKAALTKIEQHVQMMYNKTLLTQKTREKHGWREVDN